RQVAQVLSLKEQERITWLINLLKLVQECERDRCRLTAPPRRLGKKTALLEYRNVRAVGIIGINLDEGDSLVNVVLTRPGDEVVLSTCNGMALRFGESQARAMGRNTRGVRGIKLRGDDEVVGLVVADPDGFLLTVCENGYG